MAPRPHGPLPLAAWCPRQSPYTQQPKAGLALLRLPRTGAPALSVHVVKAGHVLLPTEPKGDSEKQDTVAGRWTEGALGALVTPCCVTVSGNDNLEPTAPHSGSSQGRAAGPFCSRVRGWETPPRQLGLATGLAWLLSAVASGQWGFLPGGGGFSWRQNLGPSQSSALSLEAAPGYTFLVKAPPDSQGR